MTVKEYLWQIRSLESKARQALDIYRQYERHEITLRSPRYDSDRVQSSGGGGFTEQVDRIIDLQIKAKRAWNRYLVQKDKINRQIQRIEWPHGDILFKRYVEYKDFETIADEIGYSYPHTLRLHGEALQAFEQLFLKDDR